MKKILVALPIIIFSLFYLFAANSYAQSPSPIRDVDELVKEITPTPVVGIDLGTNPDVPRNLNTYTQTVFIEITSAAACLLAGVDPVRPDQPCLGFDPVTKKLGYVEKNNGGALGAMGNLIGMTFQIPASSGEYGRYLASNFGVTQKAEAVPISDEFCANPGDCPLENTGSTGLGTGFGFDGLRPLLNIWTAMRNLVYLLFVLIFIVLGLGIMFRVQIDPRAVLSIQSQLPKIVIALVLVTFSYAIAGFLVDMMYLSLFLIINVFQLQGLDASTSLATNPINAAGGLGGIGGIATDAAGGLTTVVNSLFDGTFGTIFKTIINSLFGVLAGAGIGLIGGLPGIVIGGVAGGVLGNIGFLPGVPSPFTFIVGTIAWLIIVIALFSALFRLWFILLKTYVTILIQVVFSPIWIAFGLFPGSSISFGGWIRSLTANLAAFPVVLVLFSLGKTLQDSFSKGGPNSFVPPYIGDPGDMSVFAGIIGMGIILLAPEAVNIAKSAIKAPESKLGSAIGKPLGTGQEVVGGLVGSAKKSLWHTNPYTNESSRLKTAVKGNAVRLAGKLPGMGRIQTTLNRISGKTKREEAADTEAKENEKNELKTQTPGMGGSY